MNVVRTEVPCNQCIAIPICRNRHLRESTAKCSLLDDFLEKHSIRYKPDGMRLFNTDALRAINEIFKWGSYDYSV